MTSSREPKEVDKTRQNDRPRSEDPEEDELTKAQIGLRTAESSRLKPVRH